MNKINEIMNDLYNDEVATDLETTDEKPVTLEKDSEKAEPRIDTCCKDLSTCCVIEVPKGYSYTHTTDVGVSYKKECLKLEQIGGVYDTIEGCPVYLIKYKITGCVTVHAGGRVEAPYTRYPVCCCKCVCLDNCIICCNRNLTVDNIIISAYFDGNPIFLFTECDSDFYKLSIKVRSTVSNCF